MLPLASHICISMDSLIYSSLFPHPLLVLSGYVERIGQNLQNAANYSYCVVKSEFDSITQDANMEKEHRMCMDVLRGYTYCRIELYFSQYTATHKKNHVAVSMRVIAKRLVAHFTLMEYLE